MPIWSVFRETTARSVTSTGSASIRRWHPWRSDSKGKTLLDYWLNTAGLFVATPTHICINKVTKKRNIFEFLQSQIIITFFMIFWMSFLERDMNGGFWKKSQMYFSEIFTGRVIFRRTCPTCRHESTNLGTFLKAWIAFFFLSKVVSGEGMKKRFQKNSWMFLSLIFIDWVI